MDEVANIDVEDATSFINRLPAPVKIGAMKAFSHLLGDLGSYASAWIRRPTQSVEDKTAAKSFVTAKLAEAAAARAAADPELVNLALQSWLPKELRRHGNKEKVVRIAANELMQEEDGSAANEGQIDEDWLNSFERFAEDASSEKMQKLWARVLSGKIKRPGSFRRATLRFIHELDTSTAEAFERCARYIISNNIVTDHIDKNSIFGDLLKLEAAGLITGSTGLVSYSTKSDEHGIFGLSGSKFTLVGLYLPNGTINVSSCPLTDVGKDVLQIVPNPDEFTLVMELGNWLQGKPSYRGAAVAAISGKNGTEVRSRLVKELWGENPFEVL